MSGDKTNDLPGIGKKLAEARVTAGLTQVQVAKLLGLSRPAVTEMESETRKVSAGELKELARLYKVSIEWLTGDEVEGGQSIKAAARKLNSLKAEDFKMVMRIVDSLRRGAPSGS